jgi:hypothetical protein
MQLDAPRWPSPVVGLSRRDGRMTASARAKVSRFKFIAFVYVLSIPFWIIGALTESATKSAGKNPD